MGDAVTRLSVPAPIPYRVRSVAGQAARVLRRELGREARILWFASWPRGDARPHSDIALAVRSPALLDPSALSGARERLEALETLYSFRLLDMDQTGEERLAQIEREGVEL